MNKKKCSNIFVFVEQREGVIQSVALELIGKASELAKELGEKVVAVLAGHQLSCQAQTLIEYGADEVICVDNLHLKDYITEQYTQAIHQVIIAFRPSIFLLGATTIGRDLGPRLSARLATGLTADCTKLEISEEKELMMTRPAFGGNLMATILCANNRPQMSTVRAGVMQKLTPNKKRKGSVLVFEAKFDESKFKVKLLKKVKEDKGRVDITESKILISGGRGVGSKEGFDKLRELAAVLGAEVSSSRAMVDLGLVPHGIQVGQTGKTVRPDLYFALGISGAIQHLAGMEESDFIVVINKDKYAPIFSVADIGIVGDIHQILPALTERLNSYLKK